MTTIDDRDAPWVTPEVKSALVQNRKVYSAWVKKGRPPAEHPRVQLSQSSTNSLVTSAKKFYIDDLSRKLCDPTSGPKAFHTAFKRLANKKKITNISPLVENGVFFPKFTNKANIFNDYFALQCRPFDMDSSLPPLLPLTPNSIPALPLSAPRIESIISSLNSKKACNSDNISIPC